MILKMTSFKPCYLSKIALVKKMSAEIVKLSLSYSLTVLLFNPVASHCDQGTEEKLFVKKMITYHVYRAVKGIQLNR